MLILLSVIAITFLILSIKNNINNTNEYNTRIKEEFEYLNKRNNR